MVVPVPESHSHSIVDKATLAGSIPSAKNGSPEDSSISNLANKVLSAAEENEDLLLQELGFEVTPVSLEADKVPAAVGHPKAVDERVSEKCAALGSIDSDLPHNFKSRAILASSSDVKAFDLGHIKDIKAKSVAESADSPESHTLIAIYDELGLLHFTPDFEERRKARQERGLGGGLIVGGERIDLSDDKRIGKALTAGQTAMWLQAISQVNAELRAEKQAAAEKARADEKNKAEQTSHPVDGQVAAEPSKQPQKALERFFEGVISKALSDVRRSQQLRTEERNAEAKRDFERKMDTTFKRSVDRQDFHLRKDIEKGKIGEKMNTRTFTQLDSNDHGLNIRPQT